MQNSCTKKQEFHWIGASDQKANMQGQHHPIRLNCYVFSFSPTSSHPGTPMLGVPFLYE